MQKSPASQEPASLLGRAYLRLVLSRRGCPVVIAQIPTPAKPPDGAPLPPSTSERVLSQSGSRRASIAVHHPVREEDAPSTR